MDTDRLIWKLSLFAFAGLGLVIIHPDRVLDWLADQTGRIYRLRHLIILELMAIAALFCALGFAMSLTTAITSRDPLITVALIALHRFFLWLAMEILGLGER